MTRVSGVALRTNKVTRTDGRPGPGLSWEPWIFILLITGAFWTKSTGPAAMLQRIPAQFSPFSGLPSGGANHPPQRVTAGRNSGPSCCTRVRDEAPCLYQCKVKKKEMEEKRKKKSLWQRKSQRLTKAKPPMQRTLTCNQPACAFFRLSLQGT